MELLKKLWPKAWPYFLLAALVVLFFWDCWFTGRLPFWRDVFSGMWTWSSMASKTMDTNEWLPLWNPFCGGGKPWLADPGCGFFSPYLWFFHFLPPARALLIAVAVHLYLFGAGTYALLRHWKFDVAPALLGAITMMFGTVVVALMDFRDQFSALVWGPFAFLIFSVWLERWAALPSAQPAWRRHWALLPFPLGMGVLLCAQYSSGYPQVMVILFLMFGFYGIARSFGLGGWRVLFNLPLFWMVAGFVALGLSAIQLWPSLEFTALSERGQSIDPGQNLASFGLRHWLVILLPFLFGRAGYPNEYWAETIFEYWLGNCYIGIFPLMAILFAPACLRKAGGMGFHRFLFWFFLGVGIFSLAMAGGKFLPAYMAFYNHVPGFSHFRWPSKFLQLFIYSLCVFSALGFQYFLSRRKTSGSSFLWENLATAVCALALLLWAVGWFSFGDGQLYSWLTGGLFAKTPAHVAEARGDYLLLGFFLLATVIVALASRLRWLRPRSLAVTGISLTVINLFLVGRQIAPLSSDAVYQYLPQVDALKSGDVGGYYTHSIYAPAIQYIYGGNDDNARWAKLAGASNMLQPRGIFLFYQDGIKLLRWQQLFAILAQSPPEISTRLADLMSVGFIIHGRKFEEILWGGAPKEVQVARRATALPRAYLVSRHTVKASEREVLEAMFSPFFFPGQDVVIEPSEGGSLPRALEATALPPGRILAQRQKWNSVELDVDIQHPGLLVVNQTWFPGWKATVDGRPEEIFRANFNFRAIQVRPGDRLVRLEYKPWRFFAGASISAATAVAVVILFLAWGIWKRRALPLTA